MLSFAPDIRGQSSNVVKKIVSEVYKNWNDVAKELLSQFMGFKARTTPKERLTVISSFNKQSMEMEKILDDDALMAVFSGLRPNMQYGDQSLKMDLRPITSF